MVITPCPLRPRVAVGLRAGDLVPENCISAAPRLDRWLPCVGAARRACFSSGLRVCAVLKVVRNIRWGLGAGERSTAPNAQRGEHLSR